MYSLPLTNVLLIKTAIGPVLDNQLKSGQLDPAQLTLNHALVYKIGRRIDTNTISDNYYIYYPYIY